MIEHARGREILTRDDGHLGSHHEDVVHALHASAVAAAEQVLTTISRAKYKRAQVIEKPAPRPDPLEWR